MWRQVTMVTWFLDLKIFLDGDGCFFIVERWKKSMGYRFVPDWNHAQESYVSIFSFFPMPCLQDHDLFRSRKFATLTTWLSDFTSLLQGCTRNWVKVRPPKQSLSAIWHSTCADSKWLMLSRVRGGEQGGRGGGDRGSKSSASTALHSWLPPFFPGLLP